MTPAKCPDCGFTDKDPEVVFQHVVAGCPKAPEWVRRQRAGRLPVKVRWAA